MVWMMKSREAQAACPAYPDCASQWHDPNTSPGQLADACAALLGAQRIALISHVYADGDSLGSALALRHLLETLGKTVDVYCQHPVSAELAFLPGAGAVKGPGDVKRLCALYVEAETEASALPYDLVAAIDAADCERLGQDCVALFGLAARSLVIDHHATNAGIADVDLINKHASATGVLILEAAHAMGLTLGHDAAVCLYTALSTDTGHFTQRNVNAACLRAAAECLLAGIDAAWLAEHLHRIRTLAKTRLLARALASMTVHEDGKLVVMRLTSADFYETGTAVTDTEGLIDFGIAVEGTLAALLVSDRADGVKVSMRSRPPVDVAAVALRFGGGGHALAAGCTIEKPLHEAAGLVTDALRAAVRLS